MQYRENILLNEKGSLRRLHSLLKGKKEEIVCGLEGLLAGLVPDNLEDRFEKAKGLLEAVRRETEGERAKVFNG